MLVPSSGMANYGLQNLLMNAAHNSSCTNPSICTVQGILLLLTSINVATSLSLNVPNNKVV